MPHHAARAAEPKAVHVHGVPLSAPLGFGGMPPRDPRGAPSLAVMAGLRGVRMKMYLQEALNAVAAERSRQEVLCNRGKFPWTAAQPGISDEKKLAVLAEEFGEVAKLVTESLIDPNRRSIADLREELIQVAAVALGWSEALDRELDA